MRKTFAAALAAAALAAPAPAAAPPPSLYRSPYSVRYSWPLAELTGDLRGERGRLREESSVPYEEWYSPLVRKRWGAWGPPARHYSAPEGIERRSAAWKRERVIAVAMRFRGYDYQHHHVPDWDPPEGWPWLKVGTDRNGRGVDCSNFTAFVYNLGFGIKPSSAIRTQAEKLDVAGPGRTTVRLQRIERPATYAETLKALRTGDLLFVKNRAGELAHVVIWVGAVGRAPGDVPLVLDSHGAGVRDAERQLIPAGVQLRPFTKTSWYYNSATHAHRAFRDE